MTTFSSLPLANGGCAIQAPNQPDVSLNAGPITRKTATANTMAYLRHSMAEQGAETFEPWAALDPEPSEKILGMLQQIWEAGDNGKALINAAREKNVAIVHNPNMEEGILGLYMPGLNRVEIKNPDDPRALITLGHELGHVARHYGEPSVTVSSKNEEWRNTMLALSMFPDKMDAGDFATEAKKQWWTWAGPAYMQVRRDNGVESAQANAGIRFTDEQEAVLDTIPMSDFTDFKNEVTTPGTTGLRDPYFQFWLLSNRDAFIPNQAEAGIAPAFTMAQLQPIYNQYVNLPVEAPLYDGAEADFQELIQADTTFEAPGLTPQDMEAYAFTFLPKPDSEDNAYITSPFA